MVCVDSCCLLYVALYLLCYAKVVVWCCCICSREDLLRIPEIHINPLGDRIVDAFFPAHHERQVCMKIHALFNFEIVYTVVLLLRAVHT